MAILINDKKKWCGQIEQTMKREQSRRFLLFVERNRDIGERWLVVESVKASRNG